MRLIDALSNAYSDGLREGEPKWIKTSDRLPTEADANPCLDVFAWHIDDGVVVVGYDQVQDYPNLHPLWMSIPPLPEEKQQRQPDPDTGLVPCGCGGKAKIWLSDFTWFTHVITDYEVGCTECAMTTGWVRGKQENAMNVWNTAMGYTVPPRPGAIVPDVGEMAPNGDEGAGE